MRLPLPALVLAKQMLIAQFQIRGAGRVSYWTLHLPQGKRLAKEARLTNVSLFYRCEKSSQRQNAPLFQGERVAPGRLLVNTDCAFPIPRAADVLSRLALL